MSAPRRPTDGDFVDAAGATRDNPIGFADIIPAGEFAGSATWQIRLTTEHRNGRTHDARFELHLD